MTSLYFFLFVAGVFVFFRFFLLHIAYQTFTDRVKIESIKPGMAGLSAGNKSGSDGKRVKNIEELIFAVRNDPYSIGICKMADILRYSNQGLDGSVAFLPVDRNGNGKIDYMEEIYDDLNILSRGVWIGKYPKALFSNIYFISLLIKDNTF